MEKLISTGVISRNTPIERSDFRKTSGEHCAFFGNTWEEDWEVEYHEEIRCDLKQLSMWGDIEDHWNPRRAALSPAQTDLIQFKEFCYQFDPSFRQNSTPEEHLKVYTPVAGPGQVALMSGPGDHGQSAISQDRLIRLKQTLRWRTNLFIGA